MNNKSVELALTLPGNNPVPIASPIGLSSQFKDVGSLVSQAYNVVFYIGLSLCFIWLVWGAYQYIFAGGDQESLSQARSRITWALFGLVFILLAFLITQFAGQIINPAQIGNPAGPTPFPKGLPVKI